MEQENVETRKKGLTAVLFDRLLQRLDPDRDRAGERYENLRRRLLKFFQWNSCFPEEDLADETLDRVAQKLESVEVRDVGAFLWGVAKNVVREAARKRPASNLDDLPASMEPHTGDAELSIIDSAENERRLQCLHQCIQKLSVVDRELFLDYEYYSGKGDNKQVLMRRFQLTPSALHSRAHRIKYKVEKCALRCFASSLKQRPPVMRSRETGDNR